MIKRLQRKEDERYLREAYSWDAQVPRWFQEADRVFNSGSVEDLVAQLSDPAKWFIGIFNPSLQTIVIVQNHGNGQFEGHLMARRDASTELIAATINVLLRDLLDFGLIEAFVWVAEKHRGVRKLCSIVGFQPDGIVMWRGSYHKQVIKWNRYSIQREQILMAQAA